MIYTKRFKTKNYYWAGNYQTYKEALHEAWNLKTTNHSRFQIKTIYKQSGKFYQLWIRSGKYKSWC